MASKMLVFAVGANLPINSSIPVIMWFEKATMMKITWMETLLTALPIRVGRKNFMKGNWKWPHINPAKSNNGFGICSFVKQTRARINEVKSRKSGHLPMPSAIQS